MTHKLRGVRVEKYAYYVNQLRQNVGLETGIWRQIVTSQTAHTKYKWPPYATEWKPPHEKFLRTPLAEVYNSFVASRRVAQRDRWIVTLYQKHFDLGKTCSETTDYVTCKATVDVCNRLDYVANDWHRLVDKLAIFIQRWCAFFCPAESLVFHWCKIFVAGLVNVASI